jgi:hypothetical protein
MNQYQAYLSASQIVANGAIAVSSAIPINLGQTAVVGEGGHLNAIAQGTPSAIALSSASFEQWTAGIAQPSPDGSPEPTVALPLRGTGTEVITPVDKVLLMLAANALSAGTVIYKAFAPGILVDQTGGPGRRDLHFHDNGVWSWSDGDWATAVEAEADLIPILVRSGS